MLKLPYKSKTHGFFLLGTALYLQRLVLRSQEDLRCCSNGLLGTVWLIGAGAGRGQGPSWGYRAFSSRFDEFLLAGRLTGSYVNFPGRACRDPSLPSLVGCC